MAIVTGELSVSGTGTKVWTATLKEPAQMSLTGTATFAATLTRPAQDRLGACRMAAAATLTAQGVGVTPASWTAPGTATLGAAGNVPKVHEAEWG